MQTYFKTVNASNHVQRKNMFPAQIIQSVNNRNDTYFVILSSKFLRLVGEQFPFCKFLHAIEPGCMFLSKKKIYIYVFDFKPLELKIKPILCREKTKTVPILV